jgi:hypothetical protein
LHAKLPEPILTHELTKVSLPHPHFVQKSFRPSTSPGTELLRSHCLRCPYLYGLPDPCPRAVRPETPAPALPATAATHRYSRRWRTKFFASAPIECPISPEKASSGVIFPSARLADAAICPFIAATLIQHQPRSTPKPACARSPHLVVAHPAVRDTLLTTHHEPIGRRISG